MGKRRFNIFWFLAFMLVVFYIQGIWFQSTQVLNIPYSEFEELLEKKQIDNLSISEQFIRGEFKEPRQDNKKLFITTRVEPELAADLAQAEITYTQQVENTFLKDILSWVLPVLLFIGLWFYIMRKMAEKAGAGMPGLMSVGKSKAKLYVETNIKTTFDDVAGVDEAKEELLEVVNFLKNPAEYESLGARMPKGILLVGPPGTGKTLLAKAVAGEAQVPFFSMNGSEFVEMFVGVGASRVRDLFEQARKQAPCIIFIDELDALGKARAPGVFQGGHDEKEQTLNQLLSELDGFDTTVGVVLLAATNRPEVLDPALLRAGRFDRQVLVDRPDKVGREQILKVHLRKVKFLQTVSIEHIAALTPGFTGADLANLVNEAALAATRRKSKVVADEDFLNAVERIVAGLEKKSRLMNTREREIVAYHEMGHALVGCALPGVDKVQKISIIPRGIGALGYTLQRPTEDRYLMTRQELLNKMSILLGGRVAEDIIFGEVSTGAADDLIKVTNIAEALVTKYGMSAKLGNVVFEQPQNFFLERLGSPSSQRGRSEESAKLIDEEIKKLIEDAEAVTRNILKVNQSVLEEGARLLLKKETLMEDEVMALASELTFSDEIAVRSIPKV